METTSTPGTVTTATPAGTIDELCRLRALSVATEVELFALAARWADQHPELESPDESSTAARCPAGCRSDTGDPLYGDYGGGCVGPCPEDPHGFQDRLIPSWSWSAAAPLGAALGRTTQAAQLLIRDVLIVRHRLPRLWERVLAGQVEPWRARRIAKAVIGRPRDVSDWLDEHLSPVAHKVGDVTLDRLLDEAMLRLHPEEREMEQLEALDRRHATLHRDSTNDTGIADMTIRADWKDLHDFDQTLARVAAALATLDETSGAPADSLDVRRARALGVLADPAQALALLNPDDAARTRPSKRTQLVLHITPEHLAGHDPVARNGTLGRPVLEQAVRDWCGRDDTHLQVLPVLDLADHTSTDRYEVAGRTRLRTDFIAGSCVFPWCTRTARACDHDHVVPHGVGGATCECNVAPLCRHHHRLKTHAGWRYTPLETGTWLWSDPYGQQFLRDHTGTLDVTRPRRTGSPPTGGHRPGNGCRAEVSASP